MPSSTSSFDFQRPFDFQRAIPALPWRGITVVVVLIVIAAAAAWEVYVRSLGYAPTLNDTEDLWVQARRTVQPESLVIVGDSRALFDLDFDELEKGIGNFFRSISRVRSSCLRKATRSSRNMPR